MDHDLELRAVLRRRDRESTRLRVLIERRGDFLKGQNRISDHALALVTGPPTWPELFERLDDYEVTVQGRTVPLQYGVDLPLGLEAQARYADDDGAIVGALSEDTYYELCAGAGRALFTLGHEIGHANIHPEELVDRRLAHVDSTGLDRGVVDGHKPYLDTEWQRMGSLQRC